MTIEAGSRVELRYLAEVTRGTTPSITPGDTKILRATSRNINLEKNILESAEIRADRQVADVRHGFNRVVGSPGFELSLESYDAFIEAAMSGSWAAVTVSGSPDLGAVASSNTFTRDAGSFVTDGFRPGDLVLTADFTTPANNGTFRVTAVAALSLTVSGGTLVDEAAASGPTLALIGKRVSIGTTLKTFTVERAFKGITQFQVFRGVAVNTLELNIAPEQMVGGSFGLLGMTAAALSGTSLDSAPTAAPTNSPFSAFDGEMFEGGSSIAVVTGLQFSIDNQRSLAGVVGSKYSPDVFEGTAAITGTLTAFFENATLFNKFVNETESSLWVKLEDVSDASKFMNIVFPRVKYVGAPIDPPATGPVPVSLPFRALVHPTTGTSLSFQRSNT